jgi:hypothetical protein
MCVLFRLTADCSLYDEEGTGEEGFSALRDEEEVDVAGVYIEDESVDAVYDSGDERLGDLEFRGNESRDRLCRLRRVDKVRRILLVDEDIVALTERVSSLLISSAVFISKCQ